MTGTLIFVICVQVFIIVHTVIKNLDLILEKDEALEERNKALADLSKLKLLNKLKVDHEGSPINYNPLS